MHILHYSFYQSIPFIFFITFGTLNNYFINIMGSISIWNYINLMDLVELRSRNVKLHLYPVFLL